DIDAIRQALGYDQFALYAVSYGTTLGLRYIADFGTHVQSAVFVGTVPPERAPPRFHALVASGALERVFADCAADATCGRAFPDLRGDLGRVLERMSPTDDDLARDVFMEKLRTLLYAPAGIRQVPFLIHRAASGDFAPFDAVTKPGDRRFADGLYLSITCSETFARIDVDAAIAAAGRFQFGAYRLGRQKAACATWPRASEDAALFHKAPS